VSDTFLTHQDGPAPQLVLDTFLTHQDGPAPQLVSDTFLTHQAGVRHTFLTHRDGLAHPLRHIMRVMVRVRQVVCLCPRASNPCICIDVRMHHVSHAPGRREVHKRSLPVRCSHKFCPRRAQQGQKKPTSAPASPISNGPFGARACAHTCIHTYTQAHRASFDLCHLGSAISPEPARWAPYRWPCTATSLA